LLGNDFMPKIHHISIHHNGLDYLHDAYCAVAATEAIDCYLIDASSAAHPEPLINTRFMCKILQYLAQNETTYKRRFYDRRMRDRPPVTAEMTEVERQELLLNFLPLQYLECEAHINPYKLHTVQWTDAYYQKAFGFSATAANVANVAHYYLKSLVWNVRYYFNSAAKNSSTMMKCPSWTFHYPYAYAPTLAQLANIIPQNINTYYKFDSISGPVVPQVLLLKILPPSSYSFLIRDAQQRVTRVENKELALPNKYGLHLLYNRYYHECVPMVKHLTRKQCEEFIGKCQLTELEKARNMNNMEPWMFTPLRMNSSSSSSASASTV
jgi:5'-3' exonuclease